MSITCFWDNRRLCCIQKICDTCEYQPKADDKPNGRREPVRLVWNVDYDSSIFPECPACGEMPYDLERCFFCGQKFIQDDPILQGYAEPDPIEQRDCDMCGGKGTLVGRRAGPNGHFHGRCEVCGAIFFE